MHGLPQQEAGQELLHLGGGLVALWGRGEKQSDATALRDEAQTYLEGHGP